MGGSETRDQKNLPCGVTLIVALATTSTGRDHWELLQILIQVYIQKSRFGGCQRHLEWT